MDISGLLLLVLVFSLTTETIVTDSDEVIDLQDLLKDVESSLRHFNGQEQIKTDLNELKISSKKQEQEMKAVELKHNEDIQAIEKKYDKQIEILSKTQEEGMQIFRKEFEDMKKDILENENKMNVLISEKGFNEKHMGRARDCWDLFEAGTKQNGVYRIFPVKSRESKGFDVYCDMTTDGGGWTIFQRRGQFGNPTDYFQKTWNEYKKGFGNLSREFWIGNDNLHILTRSGLYELRVTLRRGNDSAFANYKTFSVANEKQFYKLTVGDYSGTAGESLLFHNGMNFSTKDVDKDTHVTTHCAQHKGGGWWFKECQTSNLNGPNLNGGPAGSSDPKGIVWYSWKGPGISMTGSHMKIRPKDIIF